MKDRARVERRRPWLGLGLLAALVAVLLLIALPERRSPARDASTGQFEAERLLAAALALSPPDDGKQLEVQRLVDEFKQIGRDALPMAIALVCGRESLPELALDDPLTAPVHPQARAVRDQVLRAVIAQSPPRRTLEHVQEIAVGAPVEVRRVLFQLLGGIDHERTLAALLASARGLEPIQWRRDYIARPFEAALQARLAARPGGLRELRGELREMDLCLVPVVARAAAGLPNKLSIEFALDLLGRDDDSDLAVLQALARTPQHATFACDEAARANVRRLLDAADERVRRAAIDACGRLADTGAIERLVDELDGQDPVLAHAAHRALVAIAHADHGRRVEDWTRWIEAERRWEEREWGALAAQLELDDRGRVLAATRELVAHPLYRDAAAELLCERAASDAPFGREHIEALGATQSAIALGALVDALEGDDAEQAQAALECLRRLTGLALDGDPSLWRSMLLD